MEWAFPSREGPLCPGCDAFDEQQRRDADAATAQALRERFGGKPAP
jgi:hypothetical protein